MPLAPATRLGPYEIVAPLGAGGMGEVYRARDTRLGRDVAIKVLSPHLSANPEVRTRFEREARAISSLNHPHICTLYDVGREGDQSYLIMELVEGESLAQRLAHGPLPAAKVLELGAQIADALDRAHRAGVIHRDLKPGNIMLGKGGAKLMDFGLARRTADDGPAAVGSGATPGSLTQSPTVASPLTAQGTIIGTFQYMAPEQLEGADADARSDVWSLGCVLYEMATGKRAFEGRSQASVIGAIMHSEPPPLATTAPLMPSGLDALVRTCLAKDPDERWQSAGDLRRDLQRVASAASTSTATAMPVGRRRLPSAAPAWIVAAAVGVLALAYVLGPWAPRRDSARLVAFSIGVPAGMASLQVPAEADLSPDGNMLACTVLDSTNTTHIMVRSLGSIDARVIPGTDGARHEETCRPG